MSFSFITCLSYRIRIFFKRESNWIRTHPRILIQQTCRVCVIVSDCKFWSFISESVSFRGKLWLIESVFTPRRALYSCWVCLCMTGSRGLWVMLIEIAKKCQVLCVCSYESPFVNGAWACVCVCLYVEWRPACVQSVCEWDAGLINCLLCLIINKYCDSTGRTRFFTPLLLWRERGAVLTRQQISSGLLGNGQGTKAKAAYVKRALE